MPLSSLDSLARIVAHLPSMWIGFHTLTIKNRRRGPRVFTLRSPNMSSQTGIQPFQGVIFAPLMKHMIHCLPWGEGTGQHTPLNATHENIEDGIDDLSSIGGRSSSFFRFREHGFNKSPLGIGNGRRISSDIHRSKIELR